MYKLMIVALFVLATGCTASQTKDEYCDPQVWGRWCDENAHELDIEPHARPLEHHAPDEVENIIFGID